MGMLSKTAMIIDDDKDLGCLLRAMLEARRILTLPCIHYRKLKNISVI
jgi:hypothetical protein